MTNDLFKLEIVYSTKLKQVSVFWIEVQSPTGNFIVGHNHCHLVSILKEQSKLTYKEVNGSEISIQIHRGFFKVADNKAIVWLD